MTRYLPWLVVALLGGILLWGPSDESAIDRQEREAIRSADTVYSVARDTLRLVRYQSDTALLFITDTVIKAKVDTVLRRERQACDAVVLACQQRVVARDQRIHTLESRTSGRLLLYGEASVSVPATLIGARMDGEAGLAFRLDPSTYLQAGATTRGEIRVSVRRQLTLF